MNKMDLVPDYLRKNELAKMLDDLIIKYKKLSRTGRIYGLIIADQDAKVLAANTFFDTNINYWDVGAIGAALFGISKQGRDFFSSSDLERATIIYKDSQFFVHSIGDVSLYHNQKRELILIVIGDKKINIGLIVMLMRRIAPEIKIQVEKSENAQETMKMSELEFTNQINALKEDLFKIRNA